MNNKHKIIVKKFISKPYALKFFRSYYHCSLPEAKKLVDNLPHTLKYYYSSEEEVLFNDEGKEKIKLLCNKAEIDIITISDQTEDNQLSTARSWYEELDDYHKNMVDILCRLGCSS